MKTKDAYQEKVAVQLEELSAEIKALMAEPEGELKYFHQLAALSAQQAQVQQQLQALGQATGENKAALKADMDNSLTKLQQEIKRIKMAIHQAENEGKGWAAGLSPDGHRHVESIGWAQGVAKEDYVESIGWAQGIAKEDHVVSKGWVQGYSDEDQKQ